MKFEIRNGNNTPSTPFLVVSDDRAAESPTLFGPSDKLQMRYDASHFSDPEGRYEWAFTIAWPIQTGQVFTFATTDREVSCVAVSETEFELCERPDPRSRVVRNTQRVPLRLAGTKPPPLTILIATLDRRDFLEWTLWYIYETSTDEERNIWIWDNGSHDDTPQFLGMMQKWPGVRCFRSEENVGLVGARKRMLPYVETPYVFTLDDDMWVLNKGWCTGVVGAMDADPSIYQMALSITGHWHNNYGIVHETLDRPFFRVPYVQPMPRSAAKGVVAPEGSEIRFLDDETVIVPTGKEMPFAVSGSASAWRTSDLLPLLARDDRHPVMDLSEAWGHVLRDRPDAKNATICNYSVISPCPGPLWHLGRGERYWERRCEIAPAIYNRSSETQRSWLENARRASGWGQSLENPDDALPVKL